jgi:hypothetical protein
LVSVSSAVVGRACGTGFGATGGSTFAVGEAGGSTFAAGAAGGSALTAGAAGASGVVWPEDGKASRKRNPSSAGMIAVEGLGMLPGVL